MPPLPNVRQERFVQGLFQGKSATQSYIDAGYKPSQPNSSRMTWYDMVQARLGELQQETVKESKITVESLMAELEDARAKATDLNQLAAAVRATSEKIKLSGLAVQKIEVAEREYFSDDMSTQDILTEVARKAGREAAIALCRAFQMNPNDFDLSGSPVEPSAGYGVSQRALEERKPNGRKRHRFLAGNSG
jgi:phage terminase small subunit